MTVVVETETRIFSCCITIVDSLPLTNHTTDEVRLFLRRDCPMCGARMSHKLLRARVTKKRCGLACAGSKSHVCACSCGGANHGKNYRRATP